MSSSRLRRWPAFCDPIETRGIKPIALVAPAGLRCFRCSSAVWRVGRTVGRGFDFPGKGRHVAWRRAPGLGLRRGFRPRNGHGPVRLGLTSREGPCVSPAHTTSCATCPRIGSEHARVMACGGRLFEFSYQRFRGGFGCELSRSKCTKDLIARYNGAVSSSVVRILQNNSAEAVDYISLPTTPLRRKAHDAPSSESWILDELGLKRSFCNRPVAHTRKLRGKNVASTVRSSCRIRACCNLAKKSFAYSLMRAPH